MGEQQFPMSKYLSTEHRHKAMIRYYKKEYEKLWDRDQLLCALEAAGVDNWDGYDHAIEILEEWNSERS